MNTVTKAQRFFGYLIDSIIFFIPGYIVMFLAGSTGMTILITVGYLLILLGILCRDALFGGQSIGKKVMKYKVQKMNGESLAGDFKSSIIRNISLIIPFVDLVMVLTDKPRLGDGWAETKVVS